MAKKVEKAVEGKPLTRAQKTDATKQIVRELLAQNPTKHNELIDEVAKLYVLRHGDEGENPNDVKGRAGSVLDIMKKNSEVAYDGGTYALKARTPMAKPVETEETPAPKKRGRAKKVEEKTEEVVQTAEKAQEEEPPVPKKRGRAKKAETPAPVAEDEAVEKPAPKKRGRKPKAVEEKAPAVAEKTEANAEEKPAEKAVEEKKEPSVEIPLPIEEKNEEETPAVEKTEVTALVEKPKAALSQKSVMDMSFLFGDKAAKAKKEPSKGTEKREEKPLQKAEVTAREKTEKPAQKTVKPPVKEDAKVEPVKAATPKAEPVKAVKNARARTSGKAPVALTPDEKLKEAFLKRMRTLGGDYFEYYSVYLLERYSINNGRRLEGLRVSGGDHDGGIDGEIELTDALGFKETIYIQSKNWDPDKGKEEKWVVGETLLQQFIGACACRQAKDKKLHARGIFITTSRFTPEAKRILEDMSDKIVGYDGNDLYEAAKECAFGLVKKNGEWALDERLLSGPKAFFQGY